MCILRILVVGEYHIQSTALEFERKNLFYMREEILQLNEILPLKKMYLDHVLSHLTNNYFKEEEARYLFFLDLDFHDISKKVISLQESSPFVTSTFPV